MAGKKNVHTVPNRDGAGWANVVGGQTVSHHRRKDTATDAGRDIARDRGVEHLIHNTDGRIGRRNSYGNDRMPPRDKNL